MNTRSQSESYRLPCNAFTTRVHWPLRTRCRGRARTLYQGTLRPLSSKARPVPPFPGRMVLAGEPRQAHCLVHVQSTRMGHENARRSFVRRGSVAGWIYSTSSRRAPAVATTAFVESVCCKLGVCARLLAETVSASPVRIGRSVHLSLHPCDHSIEEDVLKEGYAPVRGLQEVRRRWGPPSSLFSRLRYSA
jgi:hypothetical protein